MSLIRAFHVHFLRVIYTHGSKFQALCLLHEGFFFYSADLHIPCSFPEVLIKVRKKTPSHQAERSKPNTSESWRHFNPPPPLSLASPTRRPPSSPFLLWGTCSSHLPPAVRGAGHIWLHRSHMASTPPASCETLFPLLLPTTHRQCTFKGSSLIMQHFPLLFILCWASIDMQGAGTFSSCSTGLISVFATLNANSCHFACHTSPCRTDTRLTIHVKC